MDNFNTLQEIVINRRSSKPAALNGKKIDDQQIRQLLELANWAPSHGLTEPWRFIVYSGEAVRQFCHQHAEQYRQTTPPDKFASAKYEKQAHNGDLAAAQKCGLSTGYINRPYEHGPGQKRANRPTRTGFPCCAASGCRDSRGWAGRRS